MAESPYGHVIQSDVMGFAVLVPEYGPGKTIIDFRWIFANNLINLITGGRNVIDRLYSETFPSSISNGVLVTLKEAFASGGRKVHEVYHDDGIVKRWLREVYVCASPYLIMIVEDITVGRQADKDKVEIVRLGDINTQLNRLDLAKTKFFNNISHEFRTPLSLILAPLRDVIGTNSLDASDLVKLKIVERNAIRLQKLVNNLLDFARIESGTVDVIYQPTNLTELTSEIISGFKLVIEEAGLKFRFKAQKTGRVYVNREMWEKIVLNLLSNAFKFTLKGKIEVRIEEKIHRVQLEIRDTGSGIHPRNIDRIFDRFVTIDTPGRRTSEGTGIGLSLVKELVELNGGIIKVKSKVGKGTTFIVQIKKGKGHLPSGQVFETVVPLTAPFTTSAFVNEAMAWLPNTTKPAVSRARPSVMVVDDNADMRKYIGQVLGHAYGIIEAENGRIALDLLIKGKRPDLILSDIIMPEVTGYDLASAIKNNKAFRHIPIIFLSIKTGEQAIVEGIESGADDYFEKPFSSRHLLTLIKARINQAKSRGKE